MSAQETINVIAAGLGLGIKAYESARRIQAAGYTVPNLHEFENRIAELYNLPQKKIYPTNDGGTSSSMPIEHTGHA
ncbi:hypothetical protein [Halodesulfovibrio sp.]|jgi:hypothetical protein|uniref:hypothetical protein n=1 Tax=Halodesulfovibrio sp. TaxID=1912772 RepID=UPI0025EA8603|nr:hypothetical protein [Halodesulfovibrio sp.]MCT4534976.1 hypothetical protein [Halodesulfovibrio sp.]